MIPKITKLYRISPVISCILYLRTQSYRLFLLGPQQQQHSYLSVLAPHPVPHFFSKRKHKYTTSAFLLVCAGTKSSSLIFTKCKHKYRHKHKCKHKYRYKHKYPTAAQQQNIGDRPTTMSCFLYILMQFLRHFDHGFVDIYISWFVLFICIYVRGQSNFFSEKLCTALSSLPTKAKQEN